MVISYFRGHKTYWDHIEDVWRYSDTDEIAGFPGVVRPCKKCGAIFDGSNNGKPDPCLGNLPGVDNACCGHGEEGYIRFTNGVTIKGIFTVET